MAVVENGTGIQFVLADHHGTGQLTVKASDLSQVAQRRTTPFGTERGADSLTPEQWPGTRGFVGGYDDRGTTGLISLGAREYDPALGRFISLDPVMDLTDPTQMHGYNYANNNPTTLSDPSGLMPDGCQNICINSGGDWGVEGGKSDPRTDGDGVGDVVIPTGADGGAAADGAGDTGPATTGPTEQEIQHAKDVMDKSVADVAMELGWELLKDFVGYNDLMGCMNADIMSCGMLALGITPWGKGLKAIKVLYKMIDGVVTFYKKVDDAANILARAARASEKLDPLEIVNSSTNGIFRKSGAKGFRPNAKVKDLFGKTLPDHHKVSDVKGETLALSIKKTRKAAARSDQGLIDSVNKPGDGLPIKMSRLTQNWVDEGNHRAYELQVRANDPNNRNITPETEIYIDNFPQVLN